VNTSLPNFKNESQTSGKGKIYFSPNSWNKPLSPKNNNEIKPLQGNAVVGSQ